MEPKVLTSAGNETASETVARINAARAAAKNTPAPQQNELISVLTDRLAKQGKGISTSTSSTLQDTITQAISDIQTSGNLSRQALQSERAREINYAKDRAATTYTTALEGRGGYATMTAAFRELTDTTEKSIRDLDQRYQESILKGDAETAQIIAGLRIQKLQFQQQQEQNYFSNLLAVANLQQEALSHAQQNEQFWKKMEQDQSQFVSNLEQSKYQFEQTYGLNLKEIGIKEQQLEIERKRFNLSAAEYADRKKELLKNKEMTNTTAIVAQDIRNKLASGAYTKEQFFDTDYLALVKEKTGFSGSIEELSTVISDAYNSIDMDSVAKQDIAAEQVRTGGLFGQGGAFSPIGGGLSTAGSLLSESLFGVEQGKQSTASQIDWGQFGKSILNNLPPYPGI